MSPQAGLQRFWGVAGGPATSGAYNARVNEQAAQRLATSTQDKGENWRQAALGKGIEPSVGL